MFLITTVQMSMGCEMQESKAGYTEHWNLY